MRLVAGAAAVAVATALALPGAALAHGRGATIALDYRLHLDPDSLSERIEVLAGHEEEALAYLGRAIGALEIEWPSERFARWATLRRTEEEPALAPQPSLAHVRDLIARVRASGLPVELEVEGTQAPLPAGVDLTAYRVIQEALGAPEARAATVRLRYGDDEVALEVTGLGDARPELLGVRERVALYGCDLFAEPVAGSGYAVRARLPVEHVG